MASLSTDNDNDNDGDSYGDSDSGGGAGGEAISDGDRASGSATGARQLWLSFEPVHAVVYFDPTVLDGLRALGLKGYFMGYFAARFAPLGPVGPEVVEALAYNFSPTKVHRAVPDAWTRTTPDAALDVRRRTTAVALAALVGTAVDLAVVQAAAEAGDAVVRGLDTGGRALAAANLSVAPGDDPWARLWQACTTLREHRGDGHVAALVAEGIDGLEAHVLQAARGWVPGPVLQSTRGWTDDEWAAAVSRLRARGFLDEAGGLSDEGTVVRRRIERRTDELAARPWVGHDDERAIFARGVDAVAAVIAAAGVLRFPNPIGLDRI